MRSDRLRNPRQVAASATGCGEGALTQLVNGPDRRDRSLTDSSAAAEEEADPPDPIVVQPRGLESVVALGRVELEVVAEIQERRW